MQVEKKYRRSTGSGVIDLNRQENSYYSITVDEEDFLDMLNSTDKILAPFDQI